MCLLLQYLVGTHVERVTGRVASATQACGSCRKAKRGRVRTCIGDRDEQTLRNVRRFLCWACALRAACRVVLAFISSSDCRTRTRCELYLSFSGFEFFQYMHNVLKCVCVGCLFSRSPSRVPVCVFITAGPFTKLCAWGRRRVEDMCYEIRRAEACVD